MVNAIGHANVKTGHGRQLRMHRLKEFEALPGRVSLLEVDFIIPGLKLGQFSETLAGSCLERRERHKSCRVELDAKYRHHGTV